MTYDRIVIDSYCYMIKKFTKSTPFNIGVTITLILPLILAVIFLRSHINNSVTQIIDARQKIDERINFLISLVTLSSDYNRFGRDYLTILKNVVPRQDKLFNIAQELETLAASEGLEFGFSFLGENAPNPPEFGSLNFKLNIGAKNIGKISSFIQRLEGFRYLISVNSVNINRGVGKINATINGRVYYR